jgi:hypothetical protein
MFAMFEEVMLSARIGVKLDTPVKRSAVET